MHGLIDHDATSTKIDNFDAAILAGRLLRGVGTRLVHSAGVARQVGRVGDLLGGPWQSAMTEAAWLHDVGYSDRLAVDWISSAGWGALVA